MPEVATWSNAALASFVEKGLSAAAAQVVAEIVSPQRRAYREAAAVLAAFEPANLRPFGTKGNAGEAFDELVDDCVVPFSRPGGEIIWTLNLEIRRECLKDLHKRTAFQQALDANPGRLTSPLQTYFEQYLQGSYPNLSTMNVEQLGLIIRVVEWLTDVLPQLPDLETLRNRIENKRLTAPFEYMLKDGFAGRAADLDRLRNYVGVRPAVTMVGQASRIVMTFFSSEKRPLMILTGLGGIGKTTLMAKFVYEHAYQEDLVQFPYAYLDFDSGSVGVARSESMLIQILAQLVIQYPQLRLAVARFRRHFDPYWRVAESRPSSQPAASPPDLINKLERSCLKWLAKLVRPLAVNSSDPKTPRPFLIVLDTFENLHEFSEARARKIGAYARTLQEHFPSLRVVVSGRTNPQALLASGKYDPEVLQLGDLDGPAVQSILTGWNVLDPNQRASIQAQAGGNPLTLRLASQLSLQGNLDTSVAANLQARVRRTAGETLIQGYLYDRILEHIQHPDVQKLAHPGLALRYLTPDILLNVLAKPCKLEITKPEEAERIFEELRKYAQLVYPDGDGVRHRSDVRRAILRSIDLDKCAPVREINELAVDYHSKRTDILSRGEEIYHRLRLNQNGSLIESRWMQGVEECLRGSGAELPARAQLYLISKHVQADVEGEQAASLQQFETELLTATKAQDALANGLIDSARTIITAVPHSYPSPLALPEAQMAMLDKRWNVAQQALDEAQRAALKSGQTEDLEKALLLGSQVAAERGDHDLARRLARRAGDSLEKSSRRDRYVWALVLQYRALQALKQDTAEIESQILIACAGAQWTINDPRLARQLAPVLANRDPSAFMQALEAVIAGMGSAGELAELVRLLNDWVSQHEGLAQVLRPLLDPLEESLRGSAMRSKLRIGSDTIARFINSFEHVLRRSHDRSLTLVLGAFLARQGEIPIFGIHDVSAPSS